MNGISPKQKSIFLFSNQISVFGIFSKFIDAIKEYSKYEPAYYDIEDTQNFLIKRDSEFKNTRKELQKKKNNHIYLIIRQAKKLRNRNIKI
jgi:uncharacterized protein YutD